MICKYCGTEFDTDSNFCANCGKMAMPTPKSTKKHTWIAVLLWLFFFPVMVIITIVKNKKMSKKSKIILIMSIIFIAIIGLIFGSIEEKNNYQAIVVSIENKNYEDAQGLIKDFIKQYPDSKYLSEINIKKEMVDDELSKIENERKAKEEKQENAKKANISEKAFENMITACEVIEIDYKNIKNIMSQDDWIDGKRCSFNYRGYTFLVYFNKDETVNSINSHNIKFYENGKKVKDLNCLVTIDEASRLQSQSKTYIKSILKSPDSAEFSDGFLSSYEGWSFSKDGTIYTVSSYVDSKNSFGVMIRSYFTITYELKDDTFKITSLIFDGKKVV